MGGGGWEREWLRFGGVSANWAEFEILDAFAGADGVSPSSSNAGSVMSNRSMALEM